MRLCPSSPFFTALVVSLTALTHLSAHAAELRSFSPQGETKQVRQVKANFDVPVRPLGDPSGPSPLRGNCVGTDKPIPGTARWVDTQTWVMDFGKELPAGLKCEFTPVPDYRDASGKPVKMDAAYRFNTGGPNLRSLSTVGDSHRIDEDALFFADTTGAIDPASIERSVYCVAEGIGERIPTRLAPAAERARLLKDRNLTEDNARHLAYFRCARKLPAGAKVEVVWGIGVRGTSGLATTAEEKREFRVRPEFSVAVRCERENANADCTPFGNMRLDFTAPVKREDVAKIQLVGAGGRKWAAEFAEYEEGNEDVEGVQFSGPFPPREQFRLVVPAQIRDDAGRPLTNRNRLAGVTLKTTDYPPLLKFAADFGIVELKAGGLLPVTLRNLDSLTAGDRNLPVADGSAPQTSAKVRLLRLTTDEQVIAWLRRQNESQKDVYFDRETSVLKKHSNAKLMLLPKPNGPKPMEVVGIPLGQPGYYVAEGESQYLGSRLLETPKPMYVRTEAINTNLAVHYKRGDENSLVWVTTLDTGMPVADARITLRDCQGKQLSFGKTTADGTMLIPRKLESGDKYCHTTYVFARVTSNGVEDMSMTTTDWQKGIERWRFQLPYAGIMPDVVTHTVFDRPLFRVGETVNMQHVARRHTMNGFAHVPAEQLPDRIVVSLIGGDEEYEMPISWKGGVADTTWKIPDAAKLGRYRVSFLRPGEKSSGDGDMEYEDESGWSPTTRLWPGGIFRIADFRLPVLKAEVVTGGGKPLVGRDDINVNARISYLSGGGAAGEKIRLRSEARPAWVQGRDELENFNIGNAPVDASKLNDQGWSQNDPEPVVFDDRRDLVLDREGTLNTSMQNLPKWSRPADVTTEIEYNDPSGEVRTASTLQRWFPAARVAAISGEAQQAGSDDVSLRVATLDTSLKPAANSSYVVEAWYRRAFVHRKRMLGGYYTYDTRYTLTPLGEVCKGSSDAKGMATCRFRRPAAEKDQSSAEMIVEARVRDDAGRTSYASTTVWQGGSNYGEEYWFGQDESERIDILPDRKHYQPGETAQLQVRMPFREATALVSVEREGIIDRFTVQLSGKDPRISVPIKPHYGPNAYISVLVVRGRIGDVQPTALVDLGKPAYKLGVAEINVGWQGYTLKVVVEPDKPEYKAREEITAKVRVTLADGTPAKGGEFALAVVDEALLTLSRNDSWYLLERMMGRRGYTVETATAQSQVIGKRHFGLKAVPAGGGGGAPTRELFDTLLSWQPHVVLDDKGEARIRVPNNDSLTTFRLVAIARQGAARFGTGSATVRSTRDLQLFAGLPPVVREGDRFRAMVTVRNLSKSTQSIQVTPAATPAGSSTPLAGLSTQSIELPAGEAREVAWNVQVPQRVRQIQWRFDASTTGGDRDALKVNQTVNEALQAKVTAATLEQLDGKLVVPTQRPVQRHRRHGQRRRLPQAHPGPVG
ncbi:MAG: MG2 domain-containing protein [Rhodocyclaceae bacterium]